MCFVRSHQANVQNPTMSGGRKAVNSPVASLDEGNEQIATSRKRDHRDNKNSPFDKLDLEPRPILDIKFSQFVTSSGISESIPALFESKTRGSSAGTIKNEKKREKNNPVVIVQHSYHDHSLKTEIDHVYDQKSRGGVSIPFPLKLHHMLKNAMGDGQGDIVSWQPHGRCFIVRNPKMFQDVVLPKSFKLKKLSSFQRQLNLYGFQRLTFGRDRGCYYHELFLRNKEFLARDIKRVQVKGTGVRGRSNPDQEPDFWSMNWCKHEVARPNIEDGVSRRMSSAFNTPYFGAEGEGFEISFASVLNPFRMERTNRSDPSLFMSGFIGEFSNQTNNVIQGNPYKSCINGGNEDGNLIHSFGDESFHYLGQSEFKAFGERKIKEYQVSTNGASEHQFLTRN